MVTTYNKDTGEVHRDGVLIGAVRICKMTGFALLYMVRPHWPKIYPGDLVAALQPITFMWADDSDGDAKLQAWALEHSATIGQGQFV